MLNFKLWFESSASKQEGSSKPRMCLLKLSEPNSKLKTHNIWSFSLPAGFTCPFAKICLSKADPKTGKITDSPTLDFRCYAASEEAIYPSTRKSRWNNFEALKEIGLNNVEGMSEIIHKSIMFQLPRACDKFRIHVSGDFFNESYLKAWIEVAKKMPEIVFYAYTKSIPYVLNNTFPENLIITISKGSKVEHGYDNFELEMAKKKLKWSVVVFSVEEAKNYIWYDDKLRKKKGLEIDHDDSHAFSKDKKPFALLIHGNQPAGSEARAALTRLRKLGIGGYGRKRLPKSDDPTAEPSPNPTPKPTYGEKVRQIMRKKKKPK